MAVSNEKIPFFQKKRVVIALALAGLCAMSLIFNAVTGGNYDVPANLIERDVSANPGTEETRTLLEPVRSDTDWDIITRAGHPTYYGSVAQSHAVWDGVPNGKVIFADGFNKWGDTSILSMEAYRGSDVIRGVYVSLSQFALPVTLTMEEILPIIASYMPFEIMSRYYEYERSMRILPDVGAASDDIYYVISYRLTDGAKEAYASHEHEYSGTIDVIAETNADGVVQNFSIGFGTPRWMSSLNANSRYSEEWHCDLYDYQ